MMPVALIQLCTFHAMSEQSFDMRFESNTYHLLPGSINVLDIIQNVAKPFQKAGLIFIRREYGCRHVTRSRIQHFWLHAQGDSFPRLLVFNCWSSTKAPRTDLSTPHAVVIPFARSCGDSSYFSCSVPPSVLPVRRRVPGLGEWALNVGGQPSKIVTDHKGESSANV